MRKTRLILLLIPFVGCSQGQKVLLQDYNFLVTDGEVTKLRQSNDTLYELKCYIDRPCLARPQKHYKILSTNKTEEFAILKLERLDTISSSIKSLSATRFSILVLKIRGNKNKEVGYLLLAPGLTRQQLDTIKPNIPSLTDKFFFTFFSDRYLEELSTLKKVTTRNEAMVIIETARSDKFKTLVEEYSKTEIGDMYASGLSAEILNRACIERGYNPIGAGRIIDSLLSQ